MATQDVCQVYFTNEEMNELVMKYLATEGYTATALEFLKESGIEPDRDFAPPGLINMPVLSGNMEQALTILAGFYPLILSQNLELLFHVKQQWFIEMIRNRRVEEALNFGQQFIAPFVEQMPIFLKEVEKTVFLLAFEDPYTCPFREVLQLLGISQLLKTANEVNAAFLTIPDDERDETLSSLMDKFNRIKVELNQDFYIQIPT